MSEYISQYSDDRKAVIRTTVANAQQLAKHFAEDFQDHLYLLTFANLRKELRAMGIIRILLEPDPARNQYARLAWASHVGPEPDAARSIEQAQLPMSFYKAIEDSSIAIDDTRAVIDIDQDEDYYNEVIDDVYDTMLDTLADFQSTKSLLHQTSSHSV